MPIVPGTPGPPKPGAGTTPGPPVEPKPKPIEDGQFVIDLSGRRVMDPMGQTYVHSNEAAPCCLCEWGVDRVIPPTDDLNEVVYIELPWQVNAMDVICLENGGLGYAPIAGGLGHSTDIRFYLFNNGNPCEWRYLCNSTGRTPNNDPTLWPIHSTMILPFAPEHCGDNRALITAINYVTEGPSLDNRLTVEYCKLASQIPFGRYSRNADRRLIRPGGQAYTWLPLPPPCGNSLRAYEGFQAYNVSEGWPVAIVDCRNKNVTLHSSGTGSRWNQSAARWMWRIIGLQYYGYEQYSYASPVVDSTTDDPCATQSFDYEDTMSASLFSEPCYSHSLIVIVPPNVSAPAATWLEIDDILLDGVPIDELYGSPGTIVGGNSKNGRIELPECSLCPHGMLTPMGSRVCKLLNNGCLAAYLEMIRGQRPKPDGCPAKE